MKMSHRFERTTQALRVRSVYRREGSIRSHRKQDFKTGLHMGSKIRTIAKQLVYSDPGNPWLKLYFDHVEFPDGSHGRYNRIIEGTGDPGVAVLPISSSGVGLVLQYRYAIAEQAWEIPRGYGDSADAAGEARRELLEETGLRPVELIDLGTIHPNSAVLATRIALYAATCEPGEARPARDGPEQVELKWFAVEDAMRAVDTGKIADAITLSALLRARLRGLI
jgi:ADP-ribose pyrophosphatase